MPGIIGSVITAKEDEIEVNLSSYFVRTKYCNHIWSGPNIAIIFGPSGQNIHTLSGPNIAIIFGPSGQNIFDEILVLAEKMTGPNMT